MIDTIQIQFLLATFAAWANRRHAGLIAYLIEENRVLGHYGLRSERSFDMTRGSGTPWAGSITRRT